MRGSQSWDEFKMYLNKFYPRRSKTDLGDDKPGPVLVGATAERLVCHSGHRREEHAVSQFDSADDKRLGQLRDFCHCIKTKHHNDLPND